MDTFSYPAGSPYIHCYIKPYTVATSSHNSQLIDNQQMVNTKFHFF